MQRISKSPEETKALAKDLLQEYPEEKLILLIGELGSGKTMFVKGVAEAMGLDPVSIKSPTFSLKEDHGSFIHYDLYRLETEDLMLLEQIEEDLSNGKLVLIEWPQRIKALGAKRALKIQLSHLSPNERTLEFIPPL